MKENIPSQIPLTFLPQMEHSIDSLYTALDTLLVTEQFETAFHLAGSLYPYWETYENLSDGIGWLLKLAGPEAANRFSRGARARLYLMLGNLLRHQSEYERAAACYEGGLACGHDALAYRVRASLLGGLGETAFRQGRYEAATDYYRSYLEIGQQAGDDRLVADAMNALGRLATVKGDFAEALEYHHYGRHLCEESDYPSGTAWMSNALGELERARGDHAKAADHFRDSVLVFDRLGNLGAQMLVLQNLGFALLGDDPSGSEKLLQKTLHFWERGPAKHGMSLSLIGLSRVDIARGNMKKASQQLATASRLVQRIDVQLELGDRRDYEIALEKIGKAFRQSRTDMFAFDLPGIPIASDFPNGMALTRREMATLRLVSQGLTDKQIADRLTISPHTVNAHLKSIYRKLSVGNRTAAVAAARSRHILGR